MSSVHSVNIFITSPTIFWGKEPTLLNSWVSCLFEKLNSGLCFQVSAHFHPLRFLTFIPLACIVLLLLPNSVWFSQAPTKVLQNLSAKRFSLVFFLHVRKTTPWEVTCLLLLAPYSFSYEPSFTSLLSGKIEKKIKNYLL